MKHMLWTKAAACLAASAATIAVAYPARAVTCASLPKSTFIIGSSASQPFIAGLATALAKAATPVTLIYQSKGSCVGVDAIFNGTAMTGTALYWDGVVAPTAPLSCDLASDIADVGVSDVFSNSCAGFPTPPATIGDFFGPNQVMDFIVPKASSQTMISAEAAYFVYGFGGTNGKVSPWTNDTLIFSRGATSGTQSMLAAAINVPPAKWFTGGTGNPNVLASTGVMLTTVSGSTTPEATIGIMASTDADGQRDKVKILAYQHYGQSCAWLPDSTSTSFDKINVRDGHYPVWGPMHFYAKIDSTTKLPTKPDAANFVGYFTGTVPAPTGVNLTDLEIASHTVPACAMKVKRSSELGALSASAPTGACGCYFEFKANGAAPASCMACTKDADCTGANKHCNLGYCEAN